MEIERYTLAGNNSVPLLEALSGVGVHHNTRKPRACFVTGPPGLGKTYAVTTAAERARELGALVVTISASDHPKPIILDINTQKSIAENPWLEGLASLATDLALQAQNNDINTNEMNTALALMNGTAGYSEVAAVLRATAEAFASGSQLRPVVVIFDGADRMIGGTTFTGVEQDFFRPFLAGPQCAIIHTAYEGAPTCSSIDPITENHITYIEKTMNNTPRKCLGYLTPYEKIYQKAVTELPPS